MLACVAEGNLIPGEKPFDLCFGGRRQFCDTDYADLGKYVTKCCLAEYLGQEV